MISAQGSTSNAASRKGAQRLIRDPVDGNAHFNREPQRLARLTGSLISATAEQAFDIGELEFHIGGPTVIALARQGGRLHGSEEGVHLLNH